MAKLNAFYKNTSHIENGGWMQSAMDSDVWFRLRGYASVEVRKVRSDLLEAAGKSFEAMEQAERNAFSVELAARSILVDWNLTEDGPADADGKVTQVPVPCTEEKRFEILSNPDYDDLVLEIFNLSIVVGKLSKDAIEADAKN